MSEVLVYPKLPAKFDFLFIRYRGSGLANCLFVIARAFIIAQKYDWILINPTWLNLVLGPYLRNEKDKRHYCGLFKKTGISGLSKLFHLFVLNEISLDSAIAGKRGIVVIKGLGNYFEDLLLSHEKIKLFISNLRQKETTSDIEDADFKNIIGIHIRLGDYSSERRVNLNWYKAVIEEIISRNSNKYRFFLFSDGENSELLDLLSIPTLERVFFGNALADILALSKCKLIIGSDSTFSGWAAFINQTPVIFPRKHFGRVLVNSSFEFTDNGNSSLKDFLDRVI